MIPETSGFDPSWIVGDPEPNPPAQPNAESDGAPACITNASGSPCYEVDYLPFGSENTPSGFSNSCSTNYKFTGYERDSESNNDYAFARYYSSRLMRFLSPDPLGGDTTDPQTLNKYTYARNNPVNLIDPTGLIPDPTCDGQESCGGYGGSLPCYANPSCFDPPPDPGTGPEGPVSLPSDVGSNINLPSGEGSSGDPWVWGCESGGMPCGMQFPVPGGNCTFGIYCGGIINGWTTDSNGNAVGSFPGEALCEGHPDSACTIVIWDAIAGMWSPDPAQSCFGGDAICSQGRTPRATGNIESANVANGVMAGVAESAVDGAAGALDAFQGINSNPLLRYGPGYDAEGNYMARRLASGGRWGKGGPKLPWHWHIWPR
jgi:RHS repeat-associated protein